MKTFLAFLLASILAIHFSFTQEVVCNTSFLESDWSCLGPLDDDVSNIGRVVEVWVDPGDVDHLLIGTRGSGIWQTEDGGDNWENLTADQLPAIGVREIAVDGYENIYCSTEFHGSDLNKYNYGLIYSENDGDTWVQITDFPEGFSQMETF